MKPLLELVQLDVGSSFHCERVLCDHFADDHTWHYHPEYEFAWIISSEGTRFVGDSIRRYRPGELVLLGPNLPHCWQDDTQSQAAQSPSMLVLQFADDCFGQGFLSVSEAAPVRELLSSAATGLLFTGKLAAEAGRLLGEALECSGFQRLLNLLHILHLLARSPNRSRLTTPTYEPVATCDSTTGRRMELIERYVRGNLTREIRQADIAEILSLSAPAFSRFFRSVTGNTFVAYVNQLRIHEACRRLASTPETVTDIAMACGYNNLSNFNRQFRALEGINPSTYRQLARQKNSRHVHFLSSHTTCSPGSSCSGHRLEAADELTARHGAQ